MPEEAKRKQPGLSQIGQIAVNVHRLPQAVEFYRDKLGLKLLFSAGNMAFFDCDGIRLMLAVPEKPEFDHPSSLIYFKVAEIQECFSALSGCGVEFVATPHLVARMQSCDLWMAFFRDCEQNTLALMSEVPRATGGA